LEYDILVIQIEYVAKYFIHEKRTLNTRWFRRIYATTIYCCRKTSTRFFI